MLDRSDVSHRKERHQAYLFGGSGWRRSQPTDELNLMPYTPALTYDVSALATVRAKELQTISMKLTVMDLLTNTAGWC